MIFKPAARYPADPRAVFILALSVFSGFAALALKEAPDSLNALLPAWAVVGWGSLLTLGSAITLYGMARQTVNGIILEQIGCVTVASTTIFYSGIVFWTLGLSAVQSVGIILAWGLSCGLRWIQLQVLINDSASRAKRAAFVALLDNEIMARRKGDAIQAAALDEHIETALNRRDDH